VTKYSPAEAGDGRVAEALNDLKDSAIRPAIAHGKLEKPEPQVISDRFCRLSLLGFGRDAPEEARRFGVARCSKG